MKPASFIHIAILLTVLGCANDRPQLKMVKVLEVGGVTMEDQPLVDLLANQKDIDVDLSFSFKQDSVINLIEDNQIDLAIIPNSLDLEYTSNIKTVTSLLPRVLLIIYNGEFAKPSSIKELVKDRRVGYQSPSTHDLELFADIFAYYDIDINKDLLTVPVSDSLSDFSDIDLFISLTHLHNTIVENLVDNGGKIFSLDDPDLEGEGSSVDGFLLSTPKAYSFTLPKLTFTHQPVEPILTIAVKDILIANQSVTDDIAYDIIQSVSESRAALTHDNKSYGLLDPEYNSLNTAFTVPLHDGSVRYLNRNVPSFFERYAKLLGVGISIFMLFYAIIPQFNRMMRKRRKENTDLYYKQLLTLRQEFLDGSIDKPTALSGLKEIRNIAFKHLAKDKLDADESFHILLNLFDQVQNEIKIEQDSYRS